MSDPSVVIEPPSNNWRSDNNNDNYRQNQTSLSGRRSRRDQSREQEAHGPRFAHLSHIATGDMQMLCNIFPILSSQLMKISSFEQFLVLKKNIWA